SIPFFLDLDKLLNKNIAVLGMSGSGKSYFLKSFIIRSRLQRNSQILIMDWNNEYNEVVSFLNGNVLALGANLRINMFGLYDLDNVKNIKCISDLICGLLSLNEDEGYAVYEMILAMKDHESTLNLSFLISAFRAGNDDQCSKIATKLLQLKDSPIFADSNEFPVQSMLDSVISIDLSMLRDEVQRDEISRTIFRMIIELMHRKSIGRAANGSETIIVLDEAWRLIKNSENVGVLFREGRKYGFCIALATQLASDINNEIISNTACTVIFRLQNDGDYKMLRECGIMDEGSIKEVMRLPTGSCLVSVALKENKSKASRFFIGSTDGIPSSFYFMLHGGKMHNRISHRLFVNSTKMLHANSNAKERIMNFVAENGNGIDDAQLIRLMAGMDIERAEIVYYLRKLGLKDMDIANAFGNVAAEEQSGVRA
ncbi:MAG: ATP-binding protein, partial [Candidatus Micrarchaeaceae archaeon]